MNLYFICEPRSNLDVFSISIALKTYSSIKCKSSAQFRKGIEEFGFSLRSSKHSKFGNLMLLFGSGRTKNVQRFILAHAELLVCSLNLLLIEDLVAVAVVAY